MTTSRSLLFWSRYLPVLCLVAVLLWTFRAYSYAYFWLDDFNNLMWAQTKSLPQMLVELLNPASRFHRPSGMLLYWILGKTAGLTAWPYHWVAWALHTLNTGLVYWILWRLYRSPAAAAFGSLFFAHNPVLNQIYWSFGSIFELLAATFFFSGFLIWLRVSPPGKALGLGGVAYYLAVKAKEVAVTFPFVWFLLPIRQHIPRLGLMIFGVFGLWFAYQYTSIMRSPDPQAPYFLDFSLRTWVEGYQWYLNRLIREDWSSVTWILGAGLLAIWLWRKAASTPLFFLAFTLVAMAPVIPLANHRQEFYWYIPLLGVAGLFASLFPPFSKWLRHRLGTHRATLAALLLFPLLIYYYLDLQKNAKRVEQMAQREDAASFEGFISGLSALPPPTPETTIYFTSFPEHFDKTVLTSTVRVVFELGDLEAEIVSACPISAYCVSFQDSRVTALSWP